MTLEQLGYNTELEAHRNTQGLDNFLVGRVVLEHRERYVVKTENQEYDAELVGNLRFTAESREDLPHVGDWVAISAYDEDKALIHAIYPRQSIIERRAAGGKAEKQIIATNIDCGWIVQSVNRDFSINRLERYLTICHMAKIQSVIVLSKVDLITPQELESTVTEIKSRLGDVKIVAISNMQEGGYNELAQEIESGKTYCLLGSSGVGKSTLLNHLLGAETMATGEISESIDRGKHVTSHRELVVLDNGGMIIDNPGMREVGIADATQGLEVTFDELQVLSEDCRYKDCTHLHEEDCAILEALAAGELDQNTYDNYLKMYKEQRHFSTSQEEKKRKDRGFGKMMKQVKKARKNNKY